MGDLHNAYKIYLKITLLCFIFYLFVPIAAVVLSDLGGSPAGGMDLGDSYSDISPSKISFPSKISVPDTISVWLDEKGKVVTVDMETYVRCVVASEMPSSFEIEALKAQSVAARTYAAAKIIKYDEKKPDAHPKAAVCNTTHCQVYMSEKELSSIHGDDWEKEGWKKIKKACSQTEGELLYYNSELVMQPLFFSSSGGQTENSEDVFSGAYPYLVSVDSPYEEGATHQDEEKKLSIGDFAEKVRTAYPEKNVGNVRRETIKILTRTSGGRVDQMQVGDGTEGVLRGTEVRSALGLSSALFKISFSGDYVVFTSSGFGHGVGMSQYGANGMAKEGAGYREILAHYYSGTEVA